MATHTVDFDKGEEHFDISVASGGTTSNGVSVVVDDAKITEKQDMIHALERIIDFYSEKDWPPA